MVTRKSFVTRRRNHTSRRLYNGEGNEVLITCICSKCRRSKPFEDFGIRKMADGKLRNIPQCTDCRGRLKPSDGDGSDY